MSKQNQIIMATRESLLALRQADLVKEALLQHNPHLNVTYLGITTEADKRLNVTLAKIGGKGLFVKELEAALFDKRANIAAHSMKDVPMHLPEGMAIPAIMERADPRDAFVSNRYASLKDLPSGAKVGTSSLRRKTQIALQRQDLQLINLRGNIHTRLKRLDDGDYDAIILASAGLLRMGLTARIKSYLTIEESLPAAGQGAMGIECRADDHETIAIMSALNHEETALCVKAERALCRYLGGGCSVPIAAYADRLGNQLRVRGTIASLDGQHVVRAEVFGALVDDPDALGIQAAKDLLQQGAQKILDSF